MLFCLNKSLKGEVIMAKIRNVFCLCMAFLFVASMFSINLGIASAYTTGNYVSGEVIVGLQNISIEALEAVQSKGGIVIEQIPQLNALIVKVQSGKEDMFIQNARDIPGFRYAERNGIVRAVYTPNDPEWGKLWNMRIISADKAWDVHKGTMNITVCIADTGVDYNHNDLKAHYVAGGYDWADNDGDPWDDHGHGTHCAGIAAAIMDNGIGVVGVAQVGIWTEKVLSSGGWGEWSWLASGIVHATNSGIVDIISMSLGGTGYSQLVKDACAYAWNHGLVLVAAAGNDGIDLDVTPFYPACYPEVIAVAATDSSDRRASFSNYGTKIEVAAPGVGIYSTYPGQSYVYMSGTSMACPHVSGLAGLIWSYNLEMTNQDVRDRLHVGVDDLGAPGRDEYFGYGRINAFKALVPPVPVVIEHTYTFSIGPGVSWHQYSELSDDRYGSTTGTGYVDKFVMTVTSACHITLDLVDCCLMGDTIALFKSATKYWSATSPDTVHLEGNVKAGTYNFYVAYILPNTGAFPAGYDIYIEGS